MAFSEPRRRTSDLPVTPDAAPSWWATSTSSTAQKLWDEQGRMGRGIGMFAVGSDRRRPRSKTCGPDVPLLIPLSHSGIT